MIWIIHENDGIPTGKMEIESNEEGSERSPLLSYLAFRMKMSPLKLLNWYSGPPPFMVP